MLHYFVLTILVTVVGREIVIGSDRYGSWGRRSLDPALSFAFPNDTIVWSNDRTPNLVVKSVYTGQIHPGYTCPYIVWSSESYDVTSQESHPPSAALVNFQVIPGVSELKGYPHFYTPYVIDAHFVLPHMKLYHGNPRPYWIAYIASNCVEQRENMFRLLSSRFGNSNVHGLGRCSHNRDMPNDPGWYGNAHIFKDYVFALVFEGKSITGYITEKITNAFMGGAIPIYWGSGGWAEKIFNPKAFISAHSFPTWEALADYVYDLTRNRTRIKEIQEQPVFKDNVVPEWFLVDTTPQWIREIGIHLRNIIGVPSNRSIV
jgi:hypothetical protein